MLPQEQDWCTLPRYIGLQHCDAKYKKHLDTDTHQSRDLVSPYKYFSSNRSIHCPISLSQKYNHFSPFHLFLFQDGQRIPIRQNYHEECEALVNKQANMKLYHSYVYMSMVRKEDKGGIG